MALFAKSKPLDTAVADRAKLFKLLQEAEAKIVDKTVAANDLANAGADDDTMKKAESEVTEAANLVKRRRLAVETKDAEIKTLEAERDQAADQKQRDATAIEYHKLIEELASEGAVIAASASRMAGIAARIIPMAPEANGMKNFADVLVAQIPEAVDLLSRLIREHIASVLRREAPATVKKPAAPFVSVVVAAPVRMTLFAMRPIKHTDPDSGKLIVTQKFADVEMPPTFAKVALEAKAAVRVSDPLRKQHHGTVAGHAEALHAFDLDLAMSEPKPVAADPILASPAPTPSSPFTVVDRGGPIQMKVAR
jgi:hypothetical protein